MTKQTRFSENRRLAAGVLALCVAFSILVMGPVKLNQRRASAVNVFRRGVYTEYTLSVYTDIRSAAENAGKLAALAETALGEEDAARVKQLCALILSDSDETELLSAFFELMPLTDSLYARYAALDTADQPTAKGLYANIQSAFNTIEKDGYFALAREFNDARDGFPAKAMAGLAGIDELPVGGAQ